MSCRGSLVQRCGVRMGSHWVVSVWIFARLKQYSNNVDVSKTRRHSECQVAFLTTSAFKQPAGVRAAP
jgi:hypothetical protein